MIFMVRDMEEVAKELERFATSEDSYCARAKSGPDRRAYSFSAAAYRSAADFVRRVKLVEVEDDGK